MRVLIAAVFLLSLSAALAADDVRRRRAASPPADVRRRRAASPPAPPADVRRRRAASPPAPSECVKCHNGCKNGDHACEDKCDKLCGISPPAEEHHSPPATGHGGSGLPHNAALHVHAPLAKMLMDVHVNVPQKKCEKATMGKPPPGPNPCTDKRPYDAFEKGDGYFKNVDCMKDGVSQALEQSGANVTVGYRGKIDATGREPILTQYFEAGLCPVNVHWHLGAEHLSEGEYDLHGSGPAGGGGGHRRRADGPVRLGLQCHHYDSHDKKFTTPYNWKYCVGMEVGQTYEVHWPHSAAGACASINQFQSPFYDGVFCMGGIIALDPLNTYMKIGVQGQVFVIVNDEKYYYPDLMRGAIVDPATDHWKHVTKYTGSTTGTTRDNKVCSRYTPITWQVDRKCHLVSASSFDKMCQDMSMQRDDMSMDLHAHGAREVVLDEYAANNQHNRRRELTDQARKDEAGWELERVNFHF